MSSHITCLLLLLLIKLHRVKPFTHSDSPGNHGDFVGKEFSFHMVAFVSYIVASSAMQASSYVMWVELSASNFLSLAVTGIRNKTSSACLDLSSSSWTMTLLLWLKFSLNCLGVDTDACAMGPLDTLIGV